MNDRSASIGQPRLEEILSEAIEHLHGLKAVLTEERGALEHRDSNLLEATAKSKQDIAEKLAVLDKCSADIKSLAGKTGPLSARWREFQDIARDCDLLNKTNGLIIRSRQQQVLAGLSLLRGSERNDNTYTQAGAATGNIGRRSLTEA